MCYSKNLIAPCGLYGRNAIKLNQMLNKVDGEIWIEKYGLDRKCNAKSILGLLSLGIEKGEKIVINTNSPDYENIFNNIDSIVKEFKE